MVDKETKAYADNVRSAINEFLEKRSYFLPKTVMEIALEYAKLEPKVRWKIYLRITPRWLSDELTKEGRHSNHKIRYERLSFILEALRWYGRQETAPLPEASLDDCLRLVKLYVAANALHRRGFHLGEQTPAQIVENLILEVAELKEAVTLRHPSEIGKELVDVLGALLHLVVVQKETPASLHAAMKAKFAIRFEEKPYDLSVHQPSLQPGVSGGRVAAQNPSPEATCETSGVRKDAESGRRPEPDPAVPQVPQSYRRNGW